MGVHAGARGHQKALNVNKKESVSSGFLHRQYKSAISIVKNTDFGSAAQKLKFSIKEFLSKCDQIRSFLRIWSQ